jgi:uncharacterized protein YkwD
MRGAGFTSDSSLFSAILLSLVAGCMWVEDLSEDIEEKIREKPKILIDADRERIEEALLNRINVHRQAEGLSSVKLDELAGEAATRHCENMVGYGRYTRHIDTDGYKPYHRFSRLGGVAYVQENVTWTSNGGFMESETVKSFVNRLIELHDNFYEEDESSPTTGHRDNILDPEHNRVGIGFAYDDEVTCYAEEFTNSYLLSLAVEPDVDRNGLSLAATGMVTLSGQTIAGVEVTSATVYYEPLPRELSVSQAEKESNVPVKYPVDRDPIDIADMNPGDDGTFSFDYRFSHGADRVYTVMIWGSLSWAEEDDNAPLTDICFFVEQ